MITPTMGGVGFAKYGVDYLPLFFYNFGSVSADVSRYLSNSANYPVRRKGVSTSTLTLTGVNYFYTFPSSEVTISIGFKYGSGFKFIDFVGRIVSYEHQFDFSPRPNPSYQWTANFVGVRLPKEFDDTVEEDFDTIFCTDKPCGPIETTDLSLHSGEVWHVRKAKYTEKVTLPQRFLSNTSNRLASRDGVFDSELLLEVEGDFDYWLNEIESDSNSYIYTLNYGSQSITTVPMATLELGSLSVNMSTNEIISAAIKLGANNG